MSRIATCLNTLAESGRKALVPYIVAGDPGADYTVPLMHELVAQGADILELGIPFSDPMAEGPVIQLAHERSLAHNTSLRDALAMVAEFRREDDRTPVVLMGYANPVERMGYAVFADAAQTAGVDGLLTVDIPPEESAAINVELKRCNIDNIFLIAPTTEDDRISSIAALASGYIYYVSLKGVTGAGNLDIESVKQKLAQIRAHTSLPVTVGFGIKDNESAAAIAKIAEGVVVGSALVAKVAGLVAEGGQRDTIVSEATALIGGMRSAMDAVA